MIKSIKYFWLLVLLTVPLFTGAQGDALTKKELRANRPTYIGIGVGLANSKFRDFATSPLIYQGNPTFLSLERVKLNDKRESLLQWSFSFGTYANHYNKHDQYSEVTSNSAVYSQLYQLPKPNRDKWNFKAGGSLYATGNIRINEAFNNNAYGFEGFGSIAASAKAEKDISRTQTKEWKLPLCKKVHTWYPRQRKLSYQFNLGLLNTAYRNGYIYSTYKSVVGNYDAFQNYELINGGISLRSELHYTISLHNRNKVQLSYLYSGYRTADKYDHFEMSTHVIRFNLLFNTNNK